MKKKDFVPLILSMTGGILFALGMCMTMVWNMRIQGIPVGLARIVLLVCLTPTCKGMGDVRK